MSLWHDFITSMPKPVLLVEQGTSALVEQGTLALVEQGTSALVKFRCLLVVIYEHNIFFAVVFLCFVYDRFNKPRRW